MISVEATSNKIYFLYLLVLTLYSRVGYGGYRLEQMIWFLATMQVCGRLFLPRSVVSEGKRGVKRLEIKSAIALVISVVMFVFVRIFENANRK